MKKGWEVKKLGELCEVVGGGTPSKGNPAFYSGKIPWATVRDMRQEVITETERYITEEAVQNSATKIIPKGSVIIATRVGLGKVCLLGNDTAINQDLRGIIPRDSKTLSIRFLFLWFKTMAAVIAAEGTGATVQGVKLPFITSLPIPLPPLAEQQRIVAILDEAFAGIATARANVEKNLQNARALFESHLNDVFTKGGAGWEKKKISAIANHSLGKMLDKAKNRGEPKPYLRNLNVRWFNFDLSDVLEMRFLPEEESKYTAIKGDVLVCEGGYPGRAAIWEKDEPVHFQKALHRVRFHEIEHNKWFVYYLYIKDKDGELKKHFTGSGIQHFTGEALARFEIPLPPLPKLRKAITQLDALSTETRRLESIYQQKLSELDALKKSLLHQAFTGEM